MKSVILINPIAGKGQLQKKILPAVEEKCKQESNLSYYQTKGPGDAANFIKNYEGEDKVRFYAVGGDGTLNDVVNGAMARGNCEVGLFPCGTGNDFARLFKGGKGFLDLEAQLAGSAYHIDLIKVNEGFALNMCNMGLDAQTAADVHRFAKILPGSLAYTVSMLNRLIHKLGSQLRVTIEGREVIEGSFVLTTVANGIAYGGGYYSAPRARCDDGLLDICLINEVSRLRIMSLIKSYKSGHHLDDRRFNDILTYRRAASLTIEAAKTQKLCADGEIFAIKKCEFQALPKALAFIIPQGSSIKTEHRAAVMSTDIHA